MPVVISTELFGKCTRWYVDQAEWPLVALSLVISALYVGSFWLEVSYLTLMAPLMFMLQIVAAVITTYLVSVRHASTLPQTASVCALVAFGGGAVAALWALVRFWYPWLVLNLITEPTWSAVLAGFISAVTIGFFQLPRLIDRLRSVFQPQA